MSRLDFAPKLDDIKVTDIKRGLGQFTPKPDRIVSRAALKAALKKAGYALDSAEITVSGTLLREDSGLFLEADVSKQRFILEASDAGKLLEHIPMGGHLEVTGDWRTEGTGAASREVIRPESATGLAAARMSASDEEKRFEFKNVQVSLDGVAGGSALFFAPIRTTSPGLTVYRGGAIMPRYSYTRQRLGDLKADRHAVRFALSYTPTPTLQLEAEVPYNRTIFDDGDRSGSGSGLGNVTLWGKYRFFRALETWGDKQAAFRLGVELPTGEKDAPGAEKIAAPEFVRQQLGPINGGTALHSDIAYSQARHRFIFGANIEGTMRHSRDGFRMGHEIRVNTDFEYVLLPIKYRSPGRELFAIVETTYAYRSRGRAAGREVPGSSASEFHLAPGLQFTATARVVLEASYQFPVVQNTGPLLLRTDRNLLVGIRYLY
ncbi:MAG TPA: hypothetical protein VIG62_05205 [Blastocatellia bacterium]